MNREATEDAGSVGQLVERYEELRQEGVRGARGRSLGLALFLREGMAAWMRACSTWMPKPAPRSHQHSGAALPAGWHGQMAALLADMALATAREVTS